MRRCVLGAVAVSVLVLCSLITPILAPVSKALVPTRAVASPPVIETIPFPDRINTSLNVTEYSLVSRALMLGGGSSDVELSDLNGDGLLDLMAAMYALKTISIFYRSADGNLPTYPSFNITTQNNPIGIAPIDVFASGGHQIAVLERELASSTTSLAIYNLTSETSYQFMLARTTYANARSFVVGNFSGDKYPDVAFACAGMNPIVELGIVEVRFGHVFNTYASLYGGLGTEAIAAGDLNNDGLDELAIANYYSSNIMTFTQPFMLGNPPAQTLTVTGFPVGLASGRLNGDARNDLAVITQSPSAVRFFFQSLDILPTTEDYNRTIDVQPSFLLATNLSGSAGDDLLVLSKSGNLSLGFFQRSTSPIWSASPDFKFPSGAMPTAAAVGEVDNDSFPDIVVASARSDWSGSSVALYPHRLPVYSNSNATAWTSKSAEPFALAAGDINGDDVQDLVVLNTASSLLDIFLSFAAEPQPVQLGFVPGNVIIWDFNHDGFSDVLLTMQDGPALALVFGAASFPLPSRELACGSVVTSIATGDFNNDELVDILAATGDGHLDIFLNDGQPSAFNSPYDIALTTGAGIWSVTVDDFNSDGLDDIAYTRSIRKIIVLLQQPGVPFSPSSPSYTLTHSAGADFTDLWSGDVTGDSKADIVAMMPYDDSMYLFDQKEFDTVGRPFGTLDLPEVPKFVSVMDATDDGPADVVAIFDSADLVFLYRQSGSGLPRTPSMAFVTGAAPVFVTIGDGTHDNRGDLLVLDSGSRSVSIWEQLNFPPEVHAGGPYTTRQGDQLQINGTVKTGTSEIPFMEYYWDFGDGNVSGWIRDVTPIHNYTSIGNYTLSVNAVDPAGEPAFDQTFVLVSDSYPYASFSWVPGVPYEGQSVTFTDTTWSFDHVVNRSWTVDGIYAGGERNLSVEFQNGMHAVNLEVVDSDGSVSNAIELVNVLPSAPSVRLVGPNAALEGVPVSFEVLVDEWHGGPVDPIVSYEWDFFYLPGYFIPDRYAPNSNVTTHIFSTDLFPERLTVAVRVTDSDGNSSIAALNLEIYDTGPVANFTLSTATPMEGLPLRFISSTYSFDGVINWTWVLEHPGGQQEYFYIDGQAMAALEFVYLGDGDYRITLTVRESDGNTSTAVRAFHVNEIAPFVQLSTVPVAGWAGYYEEFHEINFTANVTSFDRVVSYQWDFDAPGTSFSPDITTSVSWATHSYSDVGSYRAKVRVTDSDGSSAIQLVYVDVRHKVFVGDFDSLVRAYRNPVDTTVVTFDLIVFLVRYPDIVTATWDFGDGTTVTVPANPNTPVTHVFEPVRDYTIRVWVTDDDGYTHMLIQTLWNRPPTIVQLEPSPGAVIKNGTQILFLINPGSTSLYLVTYDVNGGGLRDFENQYRINTTGWPNGYHSIVVVARDYGGNIMTFNSSVTIDDVAPLVFVSSSKTTVYGGGKLNISVRVDDLNIEASGVVLYVKFPGDRVFLPYSVTKITNGSYYRVFEVPIREGTIEFYADVADMAGNTDSTPAYSLEVKLRFIHVAWPYLLTVSLLAALGTAVYFVREGRIAVDETFVIYNDGRLISHSTRRLKPSMDDQVLGGMFVAVQDFVKDSFKDITSFTLRRLEFGEKQILIEKGEHLFLAVILHGQASRKVALKMKKAVEEVEDSFGQHLKDWDGDLDKVRGVNDIVQKLYSRAPLFPGSMRKT